MRVVRWRWMLVPMVVMVIAGCLPKLPEMPQSFTERLNGVWSFDVAQPPAGVITESGLMAILGADVGPVPVPMRHSRAVPVFGLLSCTGNIRVCRAQGPFATDDATPRPVWLVVYPELWFAGPGSDHGWLLIDAVDGVEDGLWVHWDRIY